MIQTTFQNNPLRQLACLFVLFFITSGLKSQIVGQCFLIDQKQHDSIRIIYKALPNGFQDTTYTDAQGNFSASTSGITADTRLVFNKENYLTDTVIFKRTSNPLNIAPHILSDTKPVKRISGDVKGTFYADTIYLGVSELVVQDTDQLIIEPGTQIFLDYFFKWFGQVTCNGTPDNLIQIKCSDLDYVQPYGVFEQIWINDNKISYTWIDYGDIRLDSDKGEVTNCTITNGIYGVRIHASGATENPISNNVISNCDIGVYVNTPFNPVKFPSVINNEISHCTYGIEGGSDTRIIGNKIHNNEYGVKTAVGYLAYNDIYLNKLGIQIDGYTEDTIWNNTIVYNETGIEYFVYTKVDYNSNIIAFNSSYGINFRNKGGSSEHSLHYNTVNFSNSPVNLTNYVRVNSNGDSTDVKGNILDKDPMFYTTDTNHRHLYFLNHNSICINAGDTAKKDPDNSIRDMGAHPYVSFVGIDKGKETNKSEFSFKIYPNPAQEMIHIQFSARVTGILEVLTISGSVVKRSTLNETDVLVLDASELDTGIHLVRLNTGDKQFTSRLLIN